MQLCDTPADCPGSTCKATQRVCAQSGSYCVDDNDCNSGEHCVSTGLVCIGGSFDSFSCADDSDCYDPTDPDDVQGACTGLTPRACSLQAPCELQGDANGDVYGLAFDPTVSPATFDFYVVPIVNGAAGAVVVLRPHNDDADLYVGPQVKPTILSPTDYPFTSNNVGETTDFVRIDSYSDPTYANFIAGLSEFAAAVVGSGGEPNYTIEALFLGPSQSGDGNCDGTVNSEDVEGFIDVPFDPAARLTDESSPFARCVGADSNQDGSETAADFVATVRNIAGSAS